jgi:hypothetical protein
MQNGDPDLRSIAEEVSSEGYLARAHARARRRKSPWNLLLFALVIGFTGIIWRLLFQGMWGVHTWIYPEHVASHDQFWRKGIGIRAFVPSFLLLMPLMFVSMPIGMLLSNCVLRCIPPARKALDTEAQGVKWASFRESMYGLGRVALILVPLGLFLSFLGAATLKNLK